MHQFLALMKKFYFNLLRASLDNFKLTTLFLK